MKRIKIFIGSVQSELVEERAMLWNGYIEKVGTGIEDIINKCREYGQKTR